MDEQEKTKAPEPQSGPIYECVRCGRRVSFQELERYISFRCPYCGYRDDSAADLMVKATGDGDHDDVDCPECDQEYRLTFNFTFAYTTERMEEVSK